MMKRGADSRHHSLTDWTDRFTTKWKSRQKKSYKIITSGHQRQHVRIQIINSCLMRLYIPFALIRFNACEAIEAPYANLVVLSQLLVSLGLVVVASLVDLVTKGVLASGQTADVLADHNLKSLGIFAPAYRVETSTLLSLAISLLVSLLIPEAAPWTDSAT